MTTDGDVPRAGRMRLGGLVVLATLAWQAWVTGLEFQLDDYALLPHAGAAVGLAPVPRLPGETPKAQRLEGETVTEAYRRHAGKANYMYRPAATAFWHAVRVVDGGRLRPIVFHAAALAWHALAAWLLFRLLRDRCSDAAAALGAALFGVMPGAVQAVSWVTAGGDVMGLVYALACALALRAWARRDGAWRAAAVFAFSGITVAAKEAAIVNLAIPAVVLLAEPRDVRRGRVLRAGSLVALGAACAWTLRWMYLGTWKLEYPFDRAFSWDQIAAIPRLIGQILAPWNRSHEFRDLAPQLARVFGGDVEAATAPVRIAAAAAFALPILAGAAGGLRAVARSAAAVVLAAGFALPGAIRLWSDDGLYSWNRTFYATTAALAAAVALGGAARPRSGRARALVWAAAFLVCADFTVHAARCELRVAEHIRGKLRSLEEAAAAAPAEMRFVVVDSEQGAGGIPCLGLHVPWAFSGLYERPARKVTWTPHDEAAKRLDVWTAERGPIRMLRGAWGRYDAEPAESPPITSAIPRLAPDAADAGLLRFDEPWPMRAVAAVLLPGEATAPPGERTCEWLSVDAQGVGAAISTALGDPPKDADFFAAAPTDFEWVRTRRLVGVRLRGVRVAGQPVVLGELPAIEILEAEPASGILKIGDLPSVRFRKPPNAAGFRVRYYFNVAGVPLAVFYKTRGRDLAEGGPDSLRFRPGASDEVLWPGHGLHIRWESIEEYCKRSLTPAQVSAITVESCVEALAPDGENAVARSPWIVFRLDDPR